MALALVGPGMLVGADRPFAVSTSDTSAWSGFFMCVGAWCG